MRDKTAEIYLAIVMFMFIIQLVLTGYIAVKVCTAQVWFVRSPSINEVLKMMPEGGK